jgi:hypothetical protein
MTNDILLLKGTFEQRKSSASFGKPSIPRNKSVDAKDISDLANQLAEIARYWEMNQEVFTGALVEVHYTQIVAKSNRIKRIFSRDSTKNDNGSIVGARFSDNGRQHIITHFVPLSDLHGAIRKINLASLIVSEHFGGEISGDDIDQLDDRAVDFSKLDLTKTLFLQIVVDACYVDRFGTPNNTPSVVDDTPLIVSVFDVGETINELLRRVGIVSPKRIIDNLTAILTRDDIETLSGKCPSIIAMSLVDHCQFSKDDILDGTDQIFSISKPLNEPVIGVIDTRFDGRVYFSDWVEYHDMIHKDLPHDQADYRHGTAVSSIIVDGANLNPDLDDGCGRFRVRHFAVGKHDGIYISTLINSIQTIVAANKDIKVWNLSLGSTSEVEKNFISPVAALLDGIQSNYNVLFVVAGTNRRHTDQPGMRIGSPADSINSVVVNAVDRNGKSASYTREGIVLSFFNKPDVSYYGGDGKDDRIRVYTNTGEDFVTGTSFAAPWVARKLAYLIYILGMTRETAKALIIDSATGWDDTYSQLDAARTIGFGIVPQKIQDIVQSKKDEIKFIISGSSEEYDTYNHNIPVPRVKDEYPYIAKATLCYFPQCTRSQGVDYSNTELDIYFGRIDDDGKIKSINENRQSINFGNVPAYITEENARKYFRKWDNTKHIQQYMSKRVRPKKVYVNRLWGISIKTKERLDEKYGKGLKFGVVITLKEINGLNRIEEFVRQCSMRGWIVNRISVDSSVDIYNKLQEEMDFET